MTDMAGRLGRTGVSTAALGAAVRAPFTPRALRELLFCLIGVGFGLGVLVAPCGLGALTAAGLGAAAVPDGQPRPAATLGFLVGFPTVLVMLLVLATPVGRALGALHRTLAARLLGEAIPPRDRTGVGGGIASPSSRAARVRCRAPSDPAADPCSVAWWAVGP